MLGITAYAMMGKMKAKHINIILVANAVSSVALQVGKKNSWVSKNRSFPVMAPAPCAGLAPFS